jgi:hypothetical protein
MQEISLPAVLIPGAFALTCVVFLMLLKRRASALQRTSDAARERGEQQFEHYRERAREALSEQAEAAERGKRALKQNEEMIALLKAILEELRRS